MTRSLRFPVEIDSVMYWQMMVHRAYVRGMSDPVPLYGPRRTLSHNRVNSMLVAPQPFMVESIHICNTLDSHCLSMSVGFVPLQWVEKGLECPLLYCIAIPFVSLLKGCVRYNHQWSWRSFPCTHRSCPIMVNWNFCFCQVLLSA